MATIHRLIRFFRFWITGMYTIGYAEGVADDLKVLRAYERARILDRIQEQLTYEPTQQTRNKKVLVGLVPP